MCLGRGLVMARALGHDIQLGDRPRRVVRRGMWPAAARRVFESLEGGAPGGAPAGELVASKPVTDSGAQGEVAGSGAAGV